MADKKGAGRVHTAPVRAQYPNEREADVPLYEEDQPTGNPAALSEAGRKELVALYGEETVSSIEAEWEANQ